MPRERIAHTKRRKMTQPRAAKIFLARNGVCFNCRRQIAQHLPGVDWSDPNWGIYEEDEFTIEFNTGEDDPLESLMLHVRGGGDALQALLRLARPTGWGLLDCSTSEFIDLENPSAEGWEAFQEFRDNAIGPPKKKPAKKTTSPPKRQARQTKKKSQPPQGKKTPVKAKAKAKVKAKAKAKPPKRKSKRKKS